MQIKKYNRIFLFNKIYLFYFKFEDQCIEIYVLKAKLFKIKLDKFLIFLNFFSNQKINMIIYILNFYIYFLF